MFGLKWNFSHHEFFWNSLMKVEDERFRTLLFYTFNPSSFTLLVYFSSIEHATIPINKRRKDYASNNF